MNTKKVTVFQDLLTNSQLLIYLEKNKFTRPTNVQMQAIAKLINKGNYIVQGKTGSGKTLAFLIPLFEQLKTLETTGFQGNASRPLSIIVTPTRELSLQVFHIAKEISHFSKLKVRKLVGGDKGRPMQSVFESKIDILVATPDRLLRAVKNEELSLDDLQILIFDEADQLLEKSFQQTILELAKLINIEKTQVHMFSATRPENFEENVNEYFPGLKYQTIGKGEENRIGHSVKTKNFNTNEDDKIFMLASFVKSMDKSNGIIFVGNRYRAQSAYDKLLEMGHKKAYLIHKEIDKNQRTKVMEDFAKNGGIIVATDVLARGVDISHLNWVLNFDLPSDSEYYLHRTGRVGRAGRRGDVFNFVTQKDHVRQKRINKALISQGRIDLKLPEVKPPTKKQPKEKKKPETRKETMTKRRTSRR